MSTNIGKGMLLNIEILRRDASNEVIAYFSKLLINFNGEDIEILEVENFTNNSYKILSYETCLSLPKTELVNYFIWVDSHKLSKDTNEVLFKYFKSTHGSLGVVDIAQDYSMYLSFFDSFINQMNVIETQKEILKKLNTTIQSVLTQLQRVKGFHEKIVPIRNESFRGIGVHSRFCAGTASGGEYFDFFKSNQSIWLFSINASSYITIGSFLSLVDNWKGASSNLNFNLIEKDLRASTSDFEGLGKVSLMILRIDLLSLEVEALNIGGHEVLDNERVIVSRNAHTLSTTAFESQFTKFSLNRGEQFVILSPGYFNNTSDKIDGTSSFNFLKKNWLESPKLVQELTFQVKRKYSELDFLPFDQTIFVIGVEKHVISKV